MQKISDIINRLGEFGVMITLAALAIVVFLQVIFRYVLDLPLFWTEETARYLLVWSSLLGAGVALKKGQHIAVDYVVQKLPRNLYKASVRLAQLSVAAIVVVIIWGGVELVEITKNQISPALRIPMSYPYMAMPVGGAIMLLHCVASFFQSVPEPKDETLGR